MKNTKTLVRFYKEEDGEIIAKFPQLNYNKQLYGIMQKVCYAHIGQHSSCSWDYGNDMHLATPEEYIPLLTELIGIGYNLRVINHH